MKVWGLAAGAVACALMVLSPAPEGLSLEGWRVAAVLALVLIWWLTEALPLAVTAVTPFVLYPLLGVAPADQTARWYASPLIGLVFGGAMIGIAIAKYGLHARLARVAVRLGGGGPRRLVLAVMIASALIGMWMVATIVTIIMLQAAVAVLAATLRDDPDSHDARQFTRAMAIAVAYGAGIGSQASLVAAPANAIGAGLIAEQTGHRIEFAEWLTFGLPFAVMGVLVAWAVIVGVAFRFRVALPDRAALVAALGDGDEARTPQGRVLAVAVVTLAGLIALPWVKPYAPQLSDAAVVLSAALLLFVLPSGGAKRERLLSWDDTRGAPWSVFFVMGAAFVLSAGLNETGLAKWMAAPLAGLAGFPPWLAFLGLVAGFAVLTEVVNNFACTAIAVPAAVVLATALGVDPVPFAVAVTLAAGGGYIVPGPPWLALAVGVPDVRPADLARGGVWMVAVVPLLIAAACLVGR